ncbi:DnaT-like ssDNA-binding domain-containing protein [Pantoea agglomerans]|uniref:DnaT-like ssDNA-binding domain-containing protein n=1 Tax=Enterobacter agglomerans TaxID=549 RepID=UPI003D9FE53C
MFEGWRPSSGLRGTASKIDIELSGPPDPAMLADFVTYWEADGADYNQIQWEMKLARYLEKGRKKPAKKRTGERRGCTMVRNVDSAIPAGFRGE